MARKMCFLLKVKRPVPMRSMNKVFTVNSVLQIDQGNLIICLKKTSVEQAHDGTGKLVERDSSSAHTVNTILPDTEIHEQMTMTNGYGKVCTTTSTPSTTVRPLWTTT